MFRVMELKQMLALFECGAVCMGKGARFAVCPC